MRKKETDIGDLLNRISNDEPRAFRLFYDIYYQDVFRFAYHLTHDPAICREIISDVFFSIWQSRKRIAGIKNIESYLYVVTRNEINRYLKKHTGNLFTHLEEKYIVLEESKEHSPEEQIVDKEIEERLNQIIQGLPHRCREIFLLSRYQNLNPKDIALQLSITESTVRVQMKIAIEKIIEQLKIYFPDLTLSLLFCFIFSF